MNDYVYTPFPLSDERVIEEVLKSLEIYIKGHTPQTFDTEQCVEFALSRIPAVWKSVREIGRSESLNLAQQEDLFRLIQRVEDPVREQARRKALDYLKTLKSAQVERVTTEALVVAALRERGRLFRLDWRKYFVKVSILLSNKKIMTFNVRIRDFRENKVSQVVEQALNVAAQLEGADVSIEVGTNYYLQNPMLWKI